MTSMAHLQFEHSLFIATSSTIRYYTPLSNKVLFECDTPDGIVNARASRDKSSLFAIADSQLVILSDATQGSKKHTLKKGNGAPRLLLFSPDSLILYFTTTLSPSVQAYSIPTALMLPSQQPHPSPPTVIALSSIGDILLSASSTPPTIYLQDRRWCGSAPVNFQPTDAQTPVTCAAFQNSNEPKQSLYMHFLLGFKDGRLVMYRLHLPKLRNHCTQTFQLQPVKVGVVKKLHKPAMRGVMAAEFLPGHKSRIVSIGHDGRCRLVDFESDGGKVLRTWHVNGEPTCLSVGPRCKEGRDDVVGGVQTLIAIGTNVGTIEIFNVLGLLIRGIDVNGPIIGLEWVGDMSKPCVLPHRTMSPVPRPGGAEDRSISDEEVGTVQKHASRGVRRVSLPTGRDLFSRDRKMASRRQSDALKRPLLIGTRPRIVTETFKAPSRPVLPVSNMRHSSSSSSSSEEEQEFFTPPSSQRKRDKGKSKASIHPDPQLHIPATTPTVCPSWRKFSTAKGGGRYMIGDRDGAHDANSPLSKPKPRMIRRTSTPKWLIPKSPTFPQAEKGTSSKRRAKSHSGSDSDSLNSTNTSTRSSSPNVLSRNFDGFSASLRMTHSHPSSLKTLTAQQARLRRDFVALRQELEILKQDLLQFTPAKGKRKAM